MARHRSAATTIALAAQLHNAGHYRDAIALLSPHLNTIFKRRQELRILEAAQSIRRRVTFHTCRRRQQIQILRSEAGIRLSGAGKDQTDSQYLLALAEALHALPRVGAAERMYLLLNCLIRRSQSADWGLPVKRRLLKCLLSLRRFVVRNDQMIKPYETELCRMLSSLLHEPEAIVRQLLRQHDFHYDLGYCKRLQILRHSGSPRDASLQAIYWPDEAAYCRFIRSPGSRILLTIHMGNFVGAFNRIAAAAPPERKCFTLRRDRSEDENYLVDDNDRHRVLYHGEYSTLNLVAALRGGNCTLSALFDLNDGFGETTEVCFFDHPARFVKGPALLAIISQTPIIPFVTFEDYSQDIIEMAAVIDPQLRSGETLDAASRRITQSLAKLAEQWIKARPAQWKYLRHLPAYLVTSTVSADGIPTGLNGCVPGGNR